MRKRLSILAVLLLAVAISAYSVGGTYAKYTSTYTSESSSARVAKWAFTLGETGGALTSNFDFDLFDTVLDSETTNAGNAEDDMAALNSDKIIAPGTYGQFAIKLYNAGEVNATYSLSLNVTNANSIPVLFSVDGGSTWAANITSALAGDLSINPSAEETITVQWKWPYEVGEDTTEIADNDGVDTAKGLNGEYTVAVQATVTVTQVD